MTGVDGDLSLEVHLILSPISSFPFPRYYFLSIYFLPWQLDKLVITKNNRPVHDKSPHDEKHSREQRDSHVKSDDQSRQQIENKATEQDLQQIDKAFTSSKPEPILFAEDIKHAKVLDSSRMKPRIFKNKINLQKGHRPIPSR